MKAMKRILAGLASLALVCSSNAVAFTAIAEDSVKTGGSDIISDGEAKTNEDLISKEEQTKIDDEQRELEETRKNLVDKLRNSLRLDLDIQSDWQSSCDNWKLRFSRRYDSDLSMIDYEVTFFYKTSDRNDNWGSYKDGDVKVSPQIMFDGSRNAGEDVFDLRELFEDFKVPEGDRYIKVWAEVKCNVYGPVPVRGTEEFYIETDPVNYKFDKTKPDDFVLISNKEEMGGWTRWTVKNDPATPIKDNSNSNLDIRYTVNKPIYENWDDINKNSQGIGLNDNGFEFDCQSNSNITVYVKDRAGNINHSSIFVYDESKSLLEVSGIDKDRWVNTLKDWNIKSYYNDDIKIYYRTTKTNNPWEHNDKFDSSKAELWEPNLTIKELDSKISEEDKYIHFWLFYKGEEKKYLSEEYKFDKTPPSDFSVVKEGFGNVTFKSTSSIFDNGSGMKKNVKLVIERTGRQFDFDGSIDRDGKLTFTSNIISEWDIMGSNVRFLVYDNAGNPVGYRYNNNDTNAPSIAEKASVISAQIGNNDSVNNEAIKTEDVFYDEESKKDVAHVYASKNDFVKIAVKEKNPYQIKVAVNGTIEDKNTFYFYPENDTSKKVISKKKGNDRTSNDNDIYYCYIPLSKCEGLKNGAVNKVQLEVWDRSNKTDYKADNATVNFFYDNVDPTISDVRANEYIDLKDDIWYYSASTDDVETLSANISDKVGLRKYTVTIEDETGKSTQLCNIDISKEHEEDVQVSSGVESEDAEPEFEKHVFYNSKTTLKKVFNTRSKLKDGYYTLRIRLEDLAGNYKEHTQKMCVDTEAPVIDSYKYEYEPSVLNFLSFGIFGKETVDIKSSVFDRTCGVSDKDVKLVWGELTISGKHEKNSANFYFNGLPVNNAGNPVITLKDKIGNASKYYFTSKDDRSLTSKLDESTLLELEDENPTAKITLPKENQFLIDGEIWYPENVTISVDASDKKSGLSHVSYREEEIHNEFIQSEEGPVERVYTELKREKTEEIIDIKKNETAKYNYTIRNSGNYLLTADAMDNAGNKASGVKKNDNAQKPDDVKSETSDSDDERQKVIHIDKENPTIEKIELNNIFGEYVEPESDKYGLFFNEETKVKVYVKDDGVSAGISYVDLYKLDINGKESSLRVFSNDNKYYHRDESGEYAEFTVEKGFKGKIWALTSDKVVLENPVDFRHTSGYVYLDGTIVEDYDLHTEVSDIIVTEKATTDKKDHDDIPLYNKDIPLTVTVKDSFSGIRRVDWSIEHDNTSGYFYVDDLGNIDASNSGSAEVIYESDKAEEAITMDKNLVTSFSFNLTILSESNNVNNNEVKITLTDRSGNESTIIKHYSIDITPPVISAEMSNTNPSNERYYNTAQTVTVSVKERNFNASDVELSLSKYDDANRNWNRNVQSISNWTTSGEGDETVHTGSFSIEQDGDYGFDVSFTDMAGNRGDSFNQQNFVIDRTPPVLRTNFNEFKTGKEQNFFGCESLNKIARISITEHNFRAENANVVIMKKDAGSEHNTYSMTSTSAYGWKENGDEHILEIPFKEGDDGVYIIKVSPVDLAMNSTDSQSTVVFEVDFTKPIISERNGEYVRDEDKNYEELEIYNEKNPAEEGFIPSIGFSDTNFDHLIYDLTVYTPVYQNGKELKNTTVDKKTQQMIVDKDMFEEDKTLEETVYSLPEFEKEGVYSVDITAVDKAGNKSKLCKNTFVMMKNSDVLAYISNSDKANGEGWYSLQKDEYTPISKRPDSFSDLDITVFAQEDSDTHIVLRDENGVSKDTGVTADNSSKMYAVGVYNYRLPKEYFAENYPEGTNKDLYLWAENTKNNESSHITLGWIRIDAVAPTCRIPSDLKKNKAFIKNTKTYKLTGISESLDKSRCMVYDNGKAVPLENFEYSDISDSLTYTLDKGWHDLSFVLVDEAGNAYTIKEISFIQVGLFYCLWFRILCGIVAAGIIIGCGVFIRRKIKNRY